MFKRLLLVLAFMALTAPAFASVGVRLNGVPVGSATDINFTCGTGTNSNLSTDGSIYNIGCSPYLAAAGLASSGYVSMASSSTAINTSYSFIRKTLVTNGDPAFTAGTLANGYPGQILTIAATGEQNGAQTGGNFTITPATSIFIKTVKLTDVGDTVSFLYLDDTNGWQVLSYGPALTGSITVTYKN